jgi:hypothetical protein
VLLLKQLLDIVKIPLLASKYTLLILSFGMAIEVTVVLLTVFGTHTAGASYAPDNVALPLASIENHTSAVGYVFNSTFYAAYTASKVLSATMI